MINPLKIVLVAGARPNFMKVAPILEKMNSMPDCFQTVFVHTGQHYDDQMSKTFLKSLRLPEPDVYLGVGSASHAVQTAKVMIEFEKVVIPHKPDWIVVVGDVNSTLACALVASKLCIRIAHVEAGLRSCDRSMPEEINRIVTDQLSDILFTTCEDANHNLKNEGIPEKRIRYVGNIMIESLISHQNEVNKSSILERMKLEKGQYILLTLHRPSNVDDMLTLKGIISALRKISARLPVIFPVHPRTRARMNKYGLLQDETFNHGISLTEPQEYFDFLSLEKNAGLVLTDSGGVQEETTFYGVPCLTLRKNTERPITVNLGTNLLVGTDEDRIFSECTNILNGDIKKGDVPIFWDDRVSERIIEDILHCCPVV